LSAILKALFGRLNELITLARH